MTDYQHLRVDTSQEGIRTITLDRPDRLNAVNDALAFSVGDALADAGADDAVRVVVITGAGRAFCAGLDLAEPPALRRRRALTGSIPTRGSGPGCNVYSRARNP